MSNDVQVSDKAELSDTFQLSDKAQQQFIQWREDSAQRFNDEFVETRLLKEQRKADILLKQESALRHRLLSPRSLIPKILKISGLESITRKRAYQVNLNHHDLNLAKLPPEFQGYRILHISDLHFNGNEELIANCINAINSVEYDLCVFTGDYRYRSFGSIETAIQGLEKLRSVINTDCVAILGNHDSLTKVPFIEALGIRVLVNEQIQLEKGQNVITLVGVDDPSYYKTHNLHRAVGAENNFIANNGCALLLAHSPNLIQEAHELGFSAYLCGHTHGGQICLPGGIPLLKDANLPRWSLAAGWQYKEMAGYTSVGAGVSLVEARVCCPPEITLHTLHHLHNLT